MLSAALGLWLFTRLRARRRRRHYLMRHALPPPHASAWRHLLTSTDDMPWINAIGFSRSVTISLSEHVSRHLSLHASASLTVLDVTALTLQYVTTTTNQKQLCQIYGITPAVCSRFLRRGIVSLLAAVEEIHECRVSWPSFDEQHQFAAVVNHFTPSLHRVFGFVDGLYFPVDAPGDFATADAYYNHWKAGETITNVIAFGPDGCILWAFINAPGSWHDSALSQRLYELLSDQQLTAPGFRLLADSAFDGSCPGIMKSRDIDHLFDSGRAREAAAAVEDERVIARTRVAAEWGMRTLESVFKRLNKKLAFNPSANHKLIKLILHLNNLRCRSMQINQIANVFNQY